MIPIPIDNVPELPMTGIYNDECVAFGIFDDGVMIHYLERDTAWLITWEDIVGIGVGKLENSKFPDGEGADKPDDAIREIEKPVMP